MSRHLRTLALILAIAPALTAQTPDISPTALAAYNQGLEAEGKQQLDVALDRFETALKLAGRCSDCLESIARVQHEMTDDKAALATIARAAAAAPSPRIHARAEAIAGQIYYDQHFAYETGGGAYEKNPKHAQEALRQAEAALQAAVRDDPTNEQTLALHAHLLAALKRDDDARKEFIACAAVPGTSPTECGRVLHFSQNIDAAREEPAPAFEATTLDGKKISLDSLAGKIVLVDFWGTWCPYCIRDAPYVQSMLDSFPADKFVLLEVDSGDSESQWTAYVKKERMGGVQTRDTKNQLQSLFRVGAFPSYFILDGNGTIRLRARGTRGDLRGEIRDLLVEQSKTTTPDATHTTPKPGAN